MIILFILRNPAAEIKSIRADDCYDVNFITKFEFCGSGFQAFFLEDKFYVFIQFKLDFLCETLSSQVHVIIILTVFNNKASF